MHNDNEPVCIAQRYDRHSQPALPFLVLSRVFHLKLSSLARQNTQDTDSGAHRSLGMLADSFCKGVNIAVANSDRTEARPSGIVAHCDYSSLSIKKNEMDAVKAQY